MTSKADFSEDEWALLREAPPLVGLRVAVADHGGEAREVGLIARAYGQAHERWWTLDGEGGRLIDEILGDEPVFDQSRFGKAPDQLHVDEIVDHAAARLREAVAVLEQRATADEVDDYRQFLLGLARAVAEAHKEDGVFGVGGEPVSDRERAALDEVAAAIPARAS